MKKYRVDHSTDAVYEYDEKDECYYFLGNLNGRTLEQFAKDIAVLDYLDSHICD